MGQDTSSEFTSAHLSSSLQLEADDCRDRIKSEKAEFIDAFFRQGSKVYICGSPQLSEGVKQAVVSIWAEHEGKTEEEGWAWMRGKGMERFATDVFL
jgi:sulfite reductase alpha subunit-like flavoprotein